MKTNFKLKLWDIEDNRDCLNKLGISNFISQKINNCKEKEEIHYTSSKLKTSDYQKTFFKKIKIQIIYWEKIFSIHISCKEFIYWNSKEYQYINYKISGIKDNKKNTEEIPLDINNNG